MGAGGAPERGAHDEPTERAQVLLEELLLAEARGEAPDREAFLREHEELRALLGTLLEDNRQVRAAFGKAPSPASGSVGALIDLLRSRYGDGLDAVVSRAGDGVDRGGDDTPSRILSRLAGRQSSWTRYRRKDEIGRGGMGAVFSVWDEDLGRTLAMKVIGHGPPPAAPGTPPSDARALSRFLEEAQVTSQLDHPGVVPVHELGVDPAGRFYFTMKLVKGQTLREILAEHSGSESAWTQARVLGLLLKVCEAVSYAHAKGVIHRDLKPANIMVGHFGEVYVMDWGLAKILRHEDPTASAVLVQSPRRDSEESGSDTSLSTMEGEVIGTPAYMAPEQAAGQIELLGSTTDVYSLGAVLYHVLTGHAPYMRPGERLNHYAVVHRLCQGPPVPLHVSAPGVPAELASICEKAMAREPAERYPSVEALAGDLRAFLEGRVVAAYETGAWAEAKKWVRRNKPLAASLMTTVALLVGGLATALVLRDRAVENAALAKRNETTAKRQEAIAQENARVAKRRAEDLLTLSAFQRLSDLEREADELWPPHPEHVAAYDAWIASAAELVAGLDPDPTSDDVGHRARLASLRERARPWDEAERAAARRSHPRFGELESLERRVAASRAAHEVRSGSAQAAEAHLDVAALPRDAVALLELSEPLIHPERAVFGQEARGVALARLALEYVEDAESLARAEELVAYGLFALGRDDAALEELELAISLVPSELQPRLEQSARRLRRAVDAAREEGQGELASLQAQLAALEAEIGRRRWTFEDDDDRWWHDQLALLVAEIDAFADVDTGLWRGVSPKHGWGIERRRAFAAEVERRTITGAEVTALWAATSARVAASPAYEGLTLTPQLGLVPLGPDPDSGLEEFGHPASGEPPERDEHGRIGLDEDMSLVLVLLPGGPFWMGAQADDRSTPNYDAQAVRNEGPPQQVPLSPFLLSKYEMTQRQWERLTGVNPSHYDPAAYDTRWSATFAAWSGLHPVEQVTWYQARTVLERFDLTLPSEAQWEYGCRSGTSTAYWCGDDPTSLQGVANLSDAFGKGRGNRNWTSWESWLDDGQTVHAPIGSYRPSPWGLHDMHGNVWEWCLDLYDEGLYRRTLMRDSVIERADSNSRVFRGGSFDHTAVFARSACRSNDSPEFAYSALGVRPARALRAR